MRLIVLCPGLTESPVLESLKSEQLVPRPEELLEAMKELHSQRYVYNFFGNIFLCRKTMQYFGICRAESVAHALVYVIRCAQNGSVWISEDSKPVYEIQLPDTLPTKEASY